ncbi:uncharacterized protein LOC120353324 [Nilaparvata lugens]|uniref:uncharacterized protein LOC120353324 n=1 Tax=Nilaparvata lugens TaxID=108931 RepID=UPI00193D6DC4|nr:uncharacterized protein LOC120353324 [Nilaparvata lugens]
MVHLMESTQVLRKYIDFVRYDKPYISLSFMVTITIGTVAILSNCMVIITEQNNKEKCLMGIKDLIMVTAAFSSVANISMNPQRMLHMVNLIEKECLISNRKLAGRERNWKTVEKCYSKKKIEMETMYKNISYVLIVVYIGAVNRNLVSSLMTKTSDNKESKDWPTPFVYWCPSGYDSLLFFILVYIFQGVQLSIMCFQGYFTEVLVCLATEKVLADFETIILLLEGIANDYPHLDYLQPQFQNGALDDDLKKYMKLIVQCHQTLNRKFKDCTEISAYGTLVNTFIISFDTVFNIYLMLKVQ